MGRVQCSWVTSRLGRPTAIGITHSARGSPFLNTSFLLRPQCLSSSGSPVGGRHRAALSCVKFPRSSHSSISSENSNYQHTSENNITLIRFFTIALILLWCHSNVVRASVCRKLNVQHNTQCKWNCELVNTADNNNN